MKTVLFRILPLLLFVACSADPPLRDSILPLPDGSVVVLSGGSLFRIAADGQGVSRLPGADIRAAAVADGMLYRGGADGKVVRVALDRPADPDQLLVEAGAPLLFVRWGSTGLAAGTASRLFRIPAVSGGEGYPDLKVKAVRYAASAQGRIAWNGSRGLFLLTPGREEGVHLADDALDFVFCGEDLYWSAPDGRVHRRTEHGDTQMVKDFYPPDNSPLTVLGATPDGRYLFGVTEPGSGQPLFLSLDRQDGRIFMAPAPVGSAALAVSADYRMRYFLAAGVLHVHGFQQDERGPLRQINLPE